SPFDSAHRSDERPATTDQEIAPAAEIRAYLARHGGPSEPSSIVMPALAEPEPAAAPAVSAEPQPIVVGPAPIVVEPAAMVVEDRATEVRIIVDVPAATTPGHAEPIEPAPAESASISPSEPEPVVSEPEPVIPAPEPIATESEPIAAEPEIPTAQEVAAV